MNSFSTTLIGYNYSIRFTGIYSFEQSLLLCRFPHHQFCDFPNFNLFANDLNSIQIYRAYRLCCSLEITVNVWNSLFLSERLIISIKPKIIRYYNVPLNKFSMQLLMLSLMISMHIFYAPRSMNRKQNNFKSEKYSYIDYIV